MKSAASSAARGPGIAIAYHLLKMGVNDIILCDRAGIICEGAPTLSGSKAEISRVTNRGRMTGKLEDAMRGADVFIGVSAPGIVTPQMVKSMAENPIVFAMSNPVPEIYPDKALEAGAAVIGTGRSDFPNQINNVLAFRAFSEARLTCAQAISTKKCGWRPPTQSRHWFLTRS